jgi:predicted nucleotidyltransferase
MNKPSVANTGLQDRDIATLHTIFKKYPEITLVYLFGSRAKGNFEPGSDIDLAVMDSNVSGETIRSVKEEIEESSLPYFSDILSYHALENKDLREHIERVGIELYKSS